MSSLYATVQEVVRWGATLTREPNERTLRLSARPAGAAGAANLTIEQIGSVGELIAAVATIATLGYLAVQIRASASAVRAEGRRSSADRSTSLTSGIALDENVSRIFRAGLVNPRTLDGDERFRFRLMLAQFIQVIESIWHENQDGTASDAELERTVLTVKSILLTPGGRHVWAQQSSQHIPEFQRFVEDILKQQPEAHPAPHGSIQQDSSVDST